MKRTGAVTALLGALALGGGARGQVTGTANQAAPMLARSGSVTVKVDDYAAAQRQVQEEAARQGAILLDAKTSVNEKGRKHGWMRFRVTQARLPFLLPAVQVGGKLYAEDLGTTDNLSEYEELARRVMRLQQHEQRLGGVLQSPRRMRGSDILYLQERLFRASVDESLLTQQREDLERAAAESTLTVQLFEPGSMPPPAPGVVDLAGRYRSAAAQARGLWGAQAARAATATAYAAVFAPLWLPAVLLAFLLLFWFWRSRRWIAGQLLALAGRLLALLALAIGWLRARWDARHEPIASWPK